MEKFVCKICGKEVERSNKAMNMGNLCNSCRQRYRQLKMKQRAIDYLGGKCAVCGYDKCNDALDFHHIDSTSKEFNISTSFNMSWGVLKNELDKCKLLCSNCHRELHCAEKTRPTDYREYEKYITVIDKELSAKNKKERKEKAEKYHKDSEDRFKFIMDSINNSEIDYSSRGWGQKLADIIGMTRHASVKWVRRNMPKFYANNCYKVERVSQDDIDNFIGLYNSGISILSIANKTEFSADTVSKYLHDNGIEIRQSNYKHIGMYDNNGSLIKDFSSLSEAGQYAESNFKGRAGNVSKDNAILKISACVNGRQKTSYGYIWKEIED